MKLIRWILAIAVLSVWAALIGTALYVALYKPSETPPEGAAIVVLGGNSDGNGGLGNETALRVQKAVELYDTGAAPVIVMTAGPPASGGAPMALAMRDQAVAAGVPADAILVEDASYSTLQNALFTADIELLDKAAPILLVSHRYHLPRANASFRWAGFENVINVAADPEGGFEVSQGVLWELVKWPLNALRAAAASAAMAGDVPRENYMKYLQ